MRMARRSERWPHCLPDRVELTMSVGDENGQHNLVEVVTMALDRLSIEDRELVELKIYAGFTFREIAEITGQPQPTVATRYRRALQSMRPWLMSQLEEELPRSLMAENSVENSVENV